MPASQKSAGKGSAKKKLTKSDKEKLKKDEEERIFQEAEEAQVLAAEKVRLKKIKEREEAGERKKRENEERKIRNVLMSRLDYMNNGHIALIDQENYRQYRTTKWNRYMVCDGTPDPTILGEINTYINLKLEDTSKQDMEAVMATAMVDLMLWSELDYQVYYTPKDEINEGLIAQYNETKYDIEHLIKTKLDLATHNILLDASELQNPETSNLHYFQKCRKVSLSIWGNLAKNPRTKIFEFSNIGFTFDIPKVMTLTDCAYRVLWCKFDHYSPYCKTYHPRVKTIKDEPDEEVPVDAEDAERGEGEKEEDKEGEEGESEPIMDAHDKLDVLAALKQLDVEETTQPEVEEEIEDENEEDGVDDWYIPPTPEVIEWEDFDEYDDVIDLRSFGVIGGVFLFDLLQLPPQPKNVKNWVIRQMVAPPELVPLDYMAESPAASAKEGSEREVVKKDDRPPISLTITIPPDVVVFEEPQMARWDSKHNVWSSSGFNDIKYNEEARTVQCKTTHFGTMALLQDLHINMPFQSWEIRPRGHNHCLVTIIAAIVEVQIEIKDGACSLIQPVIPECQHLTEQSWKPQHLICMLQKYGMNIFPNVDSSKYVSILKKNPLVEERIYFEMAMTSASMAYSWSKWNTETGSDKFVFQGMELLVDKAPSEEDWSLFQFTKTRVEKLKMAEFEEDEFSDERSPDTEYVSDLFHYVARNQSDEALERVNKSDDMHKDSVHSILKSIRFLTFA